MALQLQPRQIQRQVATPAMMMEMSLLSLPINELKDAIKKEVESNPALETSDFYSAAPRSSRGNSGEGDKEGFLENVADERGETLDEHLLGELRMAGVAGRDLELCHAIIAELDADGRFDGEIPTMIMTTGATAAELETARQRVMSIEPKGCGAKDLTECFRVQADLVPANARAAFLKDLENLTSGKVAPETVKWLRKMNPFPGRLYDHRKVETVTPDVCVDASGAVSVDQRDVPDLRISQKFVEMAKDASLDEETRAYAKERVARARAFREALIRRKETMEVVAEETIGRQPDFLKQGPAGLKKLTMSEIAKAAKCDVSTVSRAAARKYVKTPRGILPLRRFFVLVDQKPIEKLRSILSSVPFGKHLSDREIAEQMAKAGYPLARRTVAKYRARLCRKNEY